MSDDERPKKSWRDLDRKRDQSSHRSESKSEVRGAMRENSREYHAYKSQLDKMFSGGGLPEALKEKLAETDAGSGAKKKKELLDALKVAVKSREVVKALKAYREEHGFPEDEDALAKLIDLDEEKIVLEALQTLERMHDEGRLKRGRSFKARLKTVKMTIDEPKVQKCVDVLLKKL